MRRVVNQLHEAEVGDQRLVVLVDQDVARLDVAMQERERMRLVDRPRDLFEIPRRGAFLDRPIDEPFGKAFALDVFHRVERPAVEFADVVNRHDVGMLESGGGGGLVPKPLDRLEVPAAQRAADDLGPNQLQGHDSLGVVLQGAKHHPHAAAADFREQFVATNPSERLLLAQLTGHRLVLFKVVSGGLGELQYETLEDSLDDVKVGRKADFVLLERWDFAVRQPQFNFKFQEFLQEQCPRWIGHRANP